MVITTTRVTQMHDIVKTLPDGPESIKEIFWSRGPWLGEELEKAWENYYEVQGYSPFATCGNDQCRSKDLYVLTSAALPSTSLSSPLHAPFTPSTPGSQVPGVDSLHQVRGGVSPSRGNASQTQASLPQATVEQNRRELVAFCQQCWQFTNFRHNKGEIGILPLMVRLLIYTYRTAEHQPGRLRGELTSQEIKKYVAMCLKPGKSTGPDRYPNELTKIMTDEEFQIVKMCVPVNEILTEDTSRQRETMNGTILQHYKGGGTNKPSDPGPVVLLNSVYQLLNYVINERLKKIVEPANILEPGQGGGRQGRCVGINMQKVHFIQQEARRQGKRVYRVDIDFKNAFNAMSQAALWQLMRMFKIPDVDLLEQIYEGTTVRLAPNDEESATITFNTGVAQGSITSPQLFNIFINALIRMLTVTRQNEDISHDADRH